MDTPDASETPEPRPPATFGPWVWVGLLILITGALVWARHANPTADWLERYASIDSLEPSVAFYAEELLIVPFAAVLVVFARLTLGLRMLGPFRPILIALAFEFTGVIPGTVFLTMILAVVALLRPRIKKDWLPYASRISIVLVIVVIVQVVLMFVASRMGWANMLRGLFFPIVVLCLVADGFARIIAESGARDAIWRGIITVVLAVVISIAFGIQAVAGVLTRYPEMMFVEIAAIILISRYVSLRLLEGWNPLHILGQIGPGDD